MSHTDGGGFGSFPCQECGHAVTAIVQTKRGKRTRKCVSCDRLSTTYEVSEIEHRFLMASSDLVKGVAGDWFPGKRRS